MNSFIKIIPMIVLLAIAPTLTFYNSSSTTWLTRGLEKFESSIPIPHYQDMFDILVEENIYSLTFLTWKGESEFLPSLFKLTVKTHTFDGKIRDKECDIDPPLVHESGWVIPKRVSFLKSDRVLLYWQAGSKIHDTDECQTIFQVIFINTCRSSKSSVIKTPKDSVSGPGIIIVKLKNTYDVIFHQSAIAPVNYFKWSFDFNGIPLHSTPEALVNFFPEVNKFTHLTNVFPLSLPSSHSGDDEYVFVGKGIDNRNIYSSLTGWSTAEKIYHSDHAFSNSSGFATICWKLKLNPGSSHIRCKCLDDRCSIPNYMLLVKNQVFHHFEEFSIHHKPDGRVLLLSEIFNITNNKVVLLVDEAESNGKCRRLAVMELPGNLDKVELSINGRNRYCFFHVTHVFALDPLHPHLNQFTAECIQMPDKIPQERVGCGAIDYANSLSIRPSN